MYIYESEIKSDQPLRRKNSEGGLNCRSTSATPSDQNILKKKLLTEF